MFKTATEDLISSNSYGTLKTKGTKRRKNRSFLSKNMGIYGKYSFVFTIKSNVGIKKRYLSIKTNDIFLAAFGQKICS